MSALRVLCIGSAHRHPDSPTPRVGMREWVPQWTAASTCSLGLYFLEGYHHASTQDRRSAVFIPLDR